MASGDDRRRRERDDWTPADYARNFSDLTPAAYASRGVRRKRALLLLLRCALSARLARHRSTYPLFIRQISRREPASARPRPSSRRQHHGRHVRARLSGRRSSARKPACVSMPKASRCKIGAAAALRDRHADGRRAANPSSGSRRRQTRIAVVGAGPAGLSCAHRLAMLGHDGDGVRRASPRSGGLNEYGIAAYKTTGTSPRREVDFILSIGGIAVETGVRSSLGRDITLTQCADRPRCRVSRHGPRGLQ